MMGKRSDFKRKPRDYYPTPRKPVLPLIPHLKPRSAFVEPCAGDGRLIDHIVELNDMVCIWASDIEPRRDDISQMDALKPTVSFKQADYIITNPPWNRKILHPLIDIYRKHAPTWLLFDADWAHTKQAAPYLPYCHNIVSVGRVSWEENGVSGKDNCAWYEFRAEKGDTIFHANS